MNTIQDIIKAIKQLQKDVAELKTAPTPPAPAPVVDADLPRRGRRARVEGEEAP